MEINRNIIARYGSLTPSKILRYFIENSIFQIEHQKHPYTFIVLGKSGPTGKTWLTTGLKKYGFVAVELTESIIPFIDYRDDENHVIKNYMDNTIIIILNQPLQKGNEE